MPAFAVGRNLRLVRRGDTPIIANLTRRSIVIYFVRGGSVNPSSQYLNSAGYVGGYWSSIPYSDTDVAYNLYFNNSNVIPSDNTYRYLGRSLRCLAR